MDVLRLLKEGSLGAETAELAFADEKLKMSVRAFTVREGVDRLFEVLVTAASTDAELDLGRVAGRAASFRLHTGDAHRPHRSWSGVCREIEQVSVEESGLSIYLLHIAPMLWRTTQRVGRRIFQHQSAVDIATAVLGEWGIEPKLRLGRATLAKPE